MALRMELCLSTGILKSDKNNLNRALAHNKYASCRIGESQVTASIEYPYETGQGSSSEIQSLAASSPCLSRQPHATILLECSPVVSHGMDARTSRVSK